jgi:hypothetical protein
MAYVAAPPITLVQLWRLYRRECRGLGSIMADARAGRLPGVEPLPSGHGFAVVDRDAAFATMKKDRAI